MEITYIYSYLYQYMHTLVTRISLQMIEKKWGLELGEQSAWPQRSSECSGPAIIGNDVIQQRIHGKRSCDDAKKIQRQGVGLDCTDTRWGVRTFKVSEGFERWGVGLAWPARRSAEAAAAAKGEEISVDGLCNISKWTYAWGDGIFGRGLPRMVRSVK